MCVSSWACRLNGGIQAIVAEQILLVFYIWHLRCVQCRSRVRIKVRDRDFILCCRSCPVASASSATCSAASNGSPGATGSAHDSAGSAGNAGSVGCVTGATPAQAASLVAPQRAPPRRVPPLSALLRQQGAAAQVANATRALRHSRLAWLLVHTYPSLNTSSMCLHKGRWQQRASMCGRNRRWRQLLRRRRRRWRRRRH